MSHCIKHNYQLVNNRYDEQGNNVEEGGEWRTEKKCLECGELFPQVEADKLKTKC